MSKEISQFEARAYKRLYELYKSTLISIIHRAKNSVEYQARKPDAMLEAMKVLSDEKVWDRHGIESKENRKIIDELEKCLGV
jgi:hypothetical protein